MHLIPGLDESFPTFELPKGVIYDNCPPLRSNEIRLWSQGNESDTFMKPLMKPFIVLISQNKIGDVQCQYTGNYSATPHAQLMWYLLH